MPNIYSQAFAPYLISYYTYKRYLSKDSDISIKITESSTLKLFLT